MYRGSLILLKHVVLFTMWPCNDVQFLESKIPLNLLPDDGAGFNVTINHVESLLKEGYNKKE